MERYTLFTSLSTRVLFPSPSSDYKILFFSVKVPEYNGFIYSPSDLNTFKNKLNLFLYICVFLLFYCVFVIFENINLKKNTKKETFFRMNFFFIWNLANKLHSFHTFFYITYRKRSTRGKVHNMSRLGIDFFFQGKNFILFSEKSC